MNLPAHPKKKDLLFYLLLFFCLVVVLLPSFLTAVFLDPAVYNNSSDTFLYLDIARHLQAREGFLCTFNVYQFWRGIAAPAVPFVHVGLSVLLAGALSLGLSLKGLILGAFAPAIVNGLLVAAIALRIYRDRGVAFWASVILAGSVCIQITVLRILTEPWSLFITLSAILIFVSKKEWNSLSLAGLAGLLFFGFLVRSAAVFYPYVFALAMVTARPGEDKPWRQAIFFVAIYTALLLLWEWFILWRYGFIFPQYPLAFKNYFWATRLTGGMFLDKTPALMPFSQGTGFVSLVRANTAQMFYVLFCVLRVLVIPAFWAVFVILRRGSRAEKLLLFLAVAQMAASVWFYPYMIMGEFSWTRFLLLPAACLLILGGRGLKDFCARFLPKTGRIFFHVVFAVILFANIYQAVRVLDVYWQEDKAHVKETSLKAAKEWVLSHTKKGELAAPTEYVVGNVDLERPVIVLPSHNMLSLNNLNDFFRIFSPQVLVFEYTLPLDRYLLASEGYVRMFQAGPLVVYRRDKGVSR